MQQQTSQSVRSSKQTPKPPKSLPASYPPPERQATDTPRPPAPLPRSPRPPGHVPPPPIPADLGKVPVTIHLSPVQLRMLMQIADDSDGGTMAEVVRRELGQHVALHLECYHGHELDVALERWAREGKEAA